MGGQPGGGSIGVETAPRAKALALTAGGETIAAPRDAVFAKIDDLHQWADWSPWEGRDPQMKKEFSGASAGVGSMYHWVGNDKVGEGRMTITEAQPGERVVILLEFIKPFASTCTSTFALVPDQFSKVTATDIGDPPRQVTDDRAQSVGIGQQNARDDDGRGKLQDLEGHAGGNPAATTR